jgi:hypothetical protein
VLPFFVIMIELILQATILWVRDGCNHVLNLVCNWLWVEVRRASRKSLSLGNVRQACPWMNC